MKKPTAKNVFAIVVLLGIVATALVYFLFFMKWKEEVDSVRSANTQLRQRVNELYDHYQKIEEYNTQTDLLIGEIDKLVDCFPADVREEDAILLALQMRRDTTIGYAGINIAERESLATVSRQVIANADVEQYSSELMFVQRVASYTSTLTYEDLKSMVRTIHDSPYRRCLNNIMLQRNEEDNILEGTAEVTFYSLTGTGKEYSEVDFGEYALGLQNLFGLTDEQELESDGAVTE